MFILPKKSFVSAKFSRKVFTYHKNNEIEKLKIKKLKNVISEIFRISSKSKNIGCFKKIRR